MSSILTSNKSYKVVQPPARRRYSFPTKEISMSLVIIHESIHQTTEWVAHKRKSKQSHRNTTQHRSKAQSTTPPPTSYWAASSPYRLSSALETFAPLRGSCLHLTSAVQQSLQNACDLQTSALQEQVDD
jgi:hypothetical protein